MSSSSSNPVYRSKVLVLGSSRTDKVGLVDALKRRGVNNRVVSKDAAVFPDVSSPDFSHQEFALPIVDHMNVVSSEADYEVFVSSNRLNHSQLLKEVFKQADFVLFVFDITDRNSFDEVNRFMTDFIILGRKPTALTVLVGMNEKTSATRQVSPKEIDAWCSITRTESAMKYFECSSASGAGLNEVNSYLVERFQSLYWASLIPTGVAFEKTVSFLGERPPGEPSPVHARRYSEDVLSPEEEAREEQAVREFLSSLSCATLITTDSSQRGDSKPGSAVVSCKSSSPGSSGSGLRGSLSPQNSKTLDWDDVRAMIELSFEDDESERRPRQQLERGNSDRSKSGGSGGGGESPMKSKRTASTTQLSVAEAEQLSSAPPVRSCVDVFRCWFPFSRVRTVSTL